MTSSRLELHKLLVEALGSTNVYFQPPSNLTMQYPCIVYSRSDIQTTKADNIIYLGKTRYSVILIGKNPDSDVLQKLIRIPYSSYSRYYASDNLHHDAFDIYY